MGANENTRIAKSDVTPHEKNIFNACDVSLSLPVFWNRGEAIPDKASTKITASILK